MQFKKLNYEIVSILHYLLTKHTFSIKRTVENASDPNALWCPFHLSASSRDITGVFYLIPLIVNENVYERLPNSVYSGCVREPQLSSPPTPICR